jgi:hypothetical protein
MFLYQQNLIAARHRFQPCAFNLSARLVWIMEITNHLCALAAILGQIECQQRDENYWMNVCGCARPQIDSCHLREEKQINFASLKLGDRRLKCPGRFFCLACVYEPDLLGKLMVASK